MPTVRLESLQVILHYAAAHGWYRGQDNVTGVFLHSKIDHEIYMRQPDGFDDGSGQVAALLLSLYGIKQGSHLWNKHMNRRLTTNGFVRLLPDYAVYTRQTETGRSITAIHVDNALTVANTKHMLAETRALLHRLFEMKEEDPDWLMNFQLIDDRKRHTVTISQTKYIDTLLKRHRMESCTPVSTPMEASLVLSKKDCPSTDDEKAEMAQFPYREVLGAITWLAVVSRPDLAFAASYLGQYSANPGKPHWKALLRVLRYLQGTRELTLTLGRVSDADPDILTGYTDANWARDIDDYHSTSGYIFKLGDAVISWNSKKQATVATSSTEAEYIAVSHGAKQAVWLRQLLVHADIAGKPPPPTTFYVDNTGAISLTKEPRFHSRTRHIPIHYHFVRELVENNTLNIKYIPTADMLADGFTKPLARPGHLFFIDRLYLRSD